MGQLRLLVWIGIRARRETVARATKQLIELKGHVKTALNTPDLADAHGFLEHFHAQIAESTKAFFLEVQQIGESAFAKQLRDAHAYWDQCQERWGKAPGYKHAIRRWTKEWFTEEVRQAQHKFVEQEIQRRWQGLTERLAQKLEITDATPLTIPS